MYLLKFFDGDCFSFHNLYIEKESKIIPIIELQFPHTVNKVHLCTPLIIFSGSECNKVVLLEG